MSKENKKIGSANQRYNDQPDPEQKKSNARLTVAFRLHEDVVNDLEDAFTELRVAGLRTKQVEMREDIVKLGLEHFPELLARYQGKPAPGSPKTEAETKDAPEEAPERGRGKISSALRE